MDGAHVIVVWGDAVKVWKNVDEASKVLKKLVKESAVLEAEKLYVDVWAVEGTYDYEAVILIECPSRWLNRWSSKFDDELRKLADYITDKTWVDTDVDVY